MTRTHWAFCVVGYEVNQKGAQTSWPHGEMQCIPSILVSHASQLWAVWWQNSLCVIKVSLFFRTYWAVERVKPAGTQPLVLWTTSYTYWLCFLSGKNLTFWTNSIQQQQLYHCTLPHSDILAAACISESLLFDTALQLQGFAHTHTKKNAGLTQIHTQQCSN